MMLTLVISAIIKYPPFGIHKSKSNLQFVSYYKRMFRLVYNFFEYYFMYVLVGLLISSKLFATVFYTTL